MQICRQRTDTRHGNEKIWCESSLIISTSWTEPSAGAMTGGPAQPAHWPGHCLRMCSLIRGKWVNQHQTSIQTSWSVVYWVHISSRFIYQHPSLISSFPGNDWTDWSLWHGYGVWLTVSLARQQALAHSGQWLLLTLLLTFRKISSSRVCLCNSEKCGSCWQLSLI